MTPVRCGAVRNRRLSGKRQRKCRGEKRLGIGQSATNHVDAAASGWERAGPRIRRVFIPGLLADGKPSCCLSGQLSRYFLVWALTAAALMLIALLAKPQALLESQTDRRESLG